MQHKYNNYDQQVILIVRTICAFCEKNTELIKKKMAMQVHSLLMSRSSQKSQKSKDIYLISTKQN